MAACHHDLKAQMGVEIYLHVFINLALVEGEWSDSRPGRSPKWNESNNALWVGGCLDPRGSMNTFGKRLLSLPGIEL